MSRYCTVQTQFKDKQALVDALMETGGWAVEQIELYQEAQNLRGHRGDIRKEEAHIIIRKRHVGGLSNDIGFVLNADGHYEAIVSEYDFGKYGTKWMNQLKGNYAFHKISREQKSRGRNVKRTRLENGRQRITVTGYR